MMRVFVFVVLGLLITELSACSTFDSLDDSESGRLQEDHDVLQSKQTIAFMSVEDLFLDQDVRDLARAAGMGDIDKARSLINSGVNVNAKGYNGVVPLYWALHSMDGFQLLLESGADPNALFGGSSVMHWAARHQNPQFLIAAIEFGGNVDLEAGSTRRTPVFETIQVGVNDHSRARSELIRSGANIDHQSLSATNNGKGGITPAIYSALLARYDVVVELLDLGANGMHIDDYGRSVLSIAKNTIDRFAPGSLQRDHCQAVIDRLTD